MFRELLIDSKIIPLVVIILMLMLFISFVKFERYVDGIEKKLIMERNLILKQDNKLLDNNK